MKWIRENWQILTTLGVVGVWGVGIIIQHTGQDQATRYDIVRATEHRERLEATDAILTERVKAVEASQVETARQLTGISVEQTAQGKQLDRIEKKIGRMVEGR
tara:strand:- start:1538 stop:1846 length:309 start_codon:yes stop_codon:yes gene_type:complete